MVTGRTTTERMRCRTKNIDIKFCNVREAVKQKLIVLKYCGSENNLASIFTNPLSIQKHRAFMEQLGLHSEQIYIWRGHYEITRIVIREIDILD